MLSGIDNYLGEVNNRLRLSVLLFSTFILGIIDYFSGSELSFSLFYTGPIMLAVWYGGHRHGLLVSFFSAAIWLLAELAMGREYSHALTLVWNTIVRLAFFLLVMELLLSVRDKVKTLENLASTDSLTGLVNRRFFLEQLERECTRVRRYPEVFTIAYLDLDNFKYVNDTNGHLVGDELLQCVGEVLSSNLRESDMAARLGGDEFAIFFPAMKGATSKKVIEKLHASLLSAMEEKRWPVTFSIGVVTYLEPLTSIREMVKMADDLMYKVKKTGKNNIYHVISPPQDV
jgi:diguanylate cyclase (GGDEF)-like protein